jgi:hypothetical protein
VAAREVPARGRHQRREVRAAKLPRETVAPTALAL